MEVLRAFYRLLFYSKDDKLLFSLSAQTEKEKILIPIASLPCSSLRRPRCKKLEVIPLQCTNMSKGEKCCLEVLSKIYKRPFYRVRPNFLRNPETGRNLELDIFNAELGIACEYNGRQHYCFPSFPGQTRQEFIAGLRRDLHKIKTCAKLGIYLIVVPYIIAHNDIERYIRQHLPK